MGRVLSGLLTLYGFFVYHFSKLNRVALGRYKTQLIKKYNPGIISVGGGTYWNKLNQVHIGENTYINGADLITTDDTEIIIGRNCLISFDVVIRTDTHLFQDSSKPIIEQGNEAHSIIIGDNVWIGHGAYIMPGVQIGNNAIIGAKAVVTHDIPSNVIAVGIPAKVLRER